MAVDTNAHLRHHQMWTTCPQCGRGDFYVGGRHQRAEYAGGQHVIVDLTGLSPINPEHCRTACECSVNQLLRLNLASTSVESNRLPEHQNPRGGREPPASGKNRRLEPNGPHSGAGGHCASRTVARLTRIRLCDRYSHHCGGRFVKLAAAWRANSEESSGTTRVHYL